MSKDDNLILEVLQIHLRIFLRERKVEKKMYLKKFLKCFLGKVGIVGNFKPDGLVVLVQQGFTELQISEKLY